MLKIFSSLDLTFSKKSLLQTPISVLRAGHTYLPKIKLSAPGIISDAKLWYIARASAKGSQLGAFSPIGYSNCYLEFKLWHLKNLKLFSIRVKELFGPIFLWGKKWHVFALFTSIFLRNRSLSNDRWLYGKKRKNGKGNLYLTGNWLGKNEMWWVEDNHVQQDL